MADSIYNKLLAIAADKFDDARNGDKLALAVEHVAFGLQSQWEDFGTLSFEDLQDDSKTRPIAEFLADGIGYQLSDLVKVGHWVVREDGIAKALYQGGLVGTLPKPLDVARVVLSVIAPNLLRAIGDNLSDVIVRELVIGGLFDFDKYGETWIDEMNSATRAEFGFDVHYLEVGYAPDFDRPVYQCCFDI